jgi:hypothetical protein
MFQRHITSLILVTLALCIPAVGRFAGFHWRKPWSWVEIFAAWTIATIVTDFVMP